MSSSDSRYFVNKLQLVPLDEQSLKNCLAKLQSAIVTAVRLIGESLKDTEKPRHEYDSLYKGEGSRS